jgi:hypothetical protein
MGPSFTIVAVLLQRSHSWVQVPWDSRPHSTFSDSRISLMWRARYPYFYSPEIWWPGYTPRHWVPLFVVTKDSQGYGGGIRTRLHRGPASLTAHSTLTTQLCGRRGPCLQRDLMCNDLLVLCVLKMEYRIFLMMVLYNVLYGLGAKHFEDARKS